MATISLATSAHIYPGTSRTVSVTAGDVIVVGASWNNTAGDASVSDTQGNSYTTQRNQAASVLFTRLMVWTAIAGSTGSVTITVSSGFSDMGINVAVFTGHVTTPTITSGGNTGMRSPDHVSLTGYKGGALWTIYANESTPIATPAASGGNTLIQYDSGHADATWYQQNLASTTTYAFGYTTSTQYNNQNSVGVAIGNPESNLNKTQPSVARIQKTVTKTQSSVARIATIKTKTQGIAARIATKPSKTQSVIARVNGTSTKTQPVNARIQKAITKTQSLTSRIGGSGSKTQAVIARIAKTVSKTQPIAAYLATRGSKTQTLTAAITATISKTQPVTARMVGGELSYKPRGKVSSNNSVVRYKPEKPYGR